MTLKIKYIIIAKMNALTSNSLFVNKLIPSDNIPQPIKLNRSLFHHLLIKLILYLFTNYCKLTTIIPNIKTITKDTIESFKKYFINCIFNLIS